ncbi:type I-E CRISPR-associated protein Cse1/CasA [Gordonia sp. NPDC003585]|uniref:type I-E CRISPR-associated protein Cse1/CasA n=1 Tax=Gordonia sp. NPDC003585 TaxID=3154275 RepID=UPI0033B6FC25
MRSSTTDVIDTFNLVDEPWIIATDLEGQTREYSIAELVVSAHRLATIGGDLPTQQFAITRLLLAIVRRAVDWGDWPIERWEELWATRELPAAELAAYLEKVRSRFDLLDPLKPFYQVPDFQSSSDAFKPVGLLVSDVPAKFQYFTTRAGSGAADLSLAEAARWIVHAQAYDPSGIKTGDKRDPRTKGGKGYPIGIAWVGQFGGVLVEGHTLAQTLLLSLALVIDGEPTMVDNDVPVWEREHLGVLPRVDIEPHGPLDLLTWQSRRIHVRYEDGRVTGVVIGNGDSFESFNRFATELWSPWRYSEIQSKKAGELRFYPRTFDPGRAVWRGVESLLMDVDDYSRGSAAGHAPGVTKWIDYLVQQSVIDSDELIVVHVYGLRYDNQASVIGAGVDDALSMRIAGLTTYELRQRACDAADTAERVSRALGALARDLTLASGGDGDGDRQRVIMQFMAAVDQPFRRWVVALGGEVDPDELVINWHRQLYGIARELSDQLVRDAGRPAFIGRSVKDHKDKSRWIDAPWAESTFRRALNRELSEAFASTGKGDNDTAGE